MNKVKYDIEMEDSQALIQTLKKSGFKYKKGAGIFFPATSAARRLIVKCKSRDLTNKASGTVP